MRAMSSVCMLVTMELRFWDESAGHFLIGFLHGEFNFPSERSTVDPEKESSLMATLSIPEKDVRPKRRFDPTNLKFCQ